MQDWQDIYTVNDVENLFENFVVPLNHGEIKFITNEKTVSVSAASSGVHIGSSNWVLKVEGEKELNKYGLLTNFCMDGEYRHSKAIDLAPLEGADCLIVSRSVLQEQLVEHHLKQEI